MPGFLKQSTAAQSRAIGPFISDSDFKTAQTGLTIANTDIKLVVNGAASANKNSGGGTHRANGVYGVTFDATDTATVGEMEVSVLVAGALLVFDKFFVVEEAVYDALFGASAPGYLQPTVAGRTLDVSAGGEAGVDWANIGSPTTAQALTGTTIATTQKVDVETIKTQAVTCAAPVAVLASVGTAATSTAQTGDSFARIGALGAGLTAVGDTAGTTTLLSRITALRAGYLDNLSAGAVALASGVTVTAIAANVIDATALATTAFDEIRDGVWAKTVTELTGDPGATPTALAAIMLPYMGIRNLRLTDSAGGTDKIHNSAGSIILTATVSDSGTVFTKAKYA